MQDKKVSVIVTSYNKANYIAEALTSVFNQTYKNLEIVIIDDASTDNSVQIIENIIKNRENVKFIRQTENKGVIFSRNRAINEASGDYILPFDSDDIIDSTYIEKAAKILDTHFDVGIVYSKARFFGAKNEPWKIPPPDCDLMLFCNLIFACAMFRKSDFIKTGGYKEYMKKGYEDWDLWLSFLELGLNCFRIEEELFYYRILNETSRSTESGDNDCLQEIRATVLKNHFNLYSKPSVIERMFTDVPKLQSKLQKYRIKNRNLIIAAVVEFLLVVGLILKLLF